MGGAQGQRPLVIAAGDGPQSGLRGADDGGQYHDAQQQRGGEQALARGAGKALHGGDDDHQSPEAVDDGGYARHEAHRGIQNAVEPAGAEVGKEHGAQHPHGHPHHDSPGGGVDGADDEGEDAIEVLGGLPDGAEEVGRADLGDGGDAVAQQVYADEGHGGDGDAGGDEKDDVHGGFFEACHRGSSLPGRPGVRIRRQGRENPPLTPLVQFLISLRCSSR